MNIGVQIKQERLRQQMKLEVLAEGICSLSHLSRIENGKSQPKEELLTRLEERLGVSLLAEEQLIVFDLTKLEDRCWQVIHSRDQVGARRLIQEINGLLAKGFIDGQTRIDLELLSLRMRFSGDEKTNLLGDLAVYQEIDQELTPIKSFRVWQLRGMALYENGDFQEGLKALAVAVCRMEQLPLSPAERADFSYIRSVMLMANGDHYEALEQVYDALPYFQSIMATRRVVECQIVSGIAYKKSGRPSKALDRFELAERICRQSELSSFAGIIYQNIGGVYSVMGNAEQAITHFKQAFEHKEEALELMYPILALVKEYERIGEYKKAVHWLGKGNCLLPKLSEKKKEYYETHFRVFEALCAQDNTAVEQALIYAVHIFKRRGNHSEWKDCAKQLANFYAGTQKYKKAVQFYKLVLNEED